MRVTEPFRGNWARAETVDGSYKLTDWTHAIRTVQTQVKSTVALSPRKKVTGEFINSSGKWTISTPIKCYKHYFNTRALPEIPVASITNAG